MSDFVIVGLGNPGVRYKHTRHNFGAMVVAQLAASNAILLREEAKFEGLYGRGIIGENKVHLLLPLTYMNLSGRAVAKLLHFFALSHSQLLVVVDDVAIPFGTARMRLSGGSGGHNGLKSIGAIGFGTAFARLRLGIGATTPLPLEEFVLAPFTCVEMSCLSQIVEQAARFIAEMIALGSFSTFLGAKQFTKEKIV